MTLILVAHYGYRTVKKAMDALQTLLNDFNVEDNPLGVNWVYRKHMYEYDATQGNRSTGTTTTSISLCVRILGFRMRPGEGNLKRRFA